MGLLFFRGGNMCHKPSNEFFSMGVHCVVHWINFAIQSLSNLTLFVQLEVFMGNLHSYFSCFPKWHLEFLKLVAMETKGNTILKNVKTLWMSILDPLRRIMAKYKLLLVFMQVDQISTQMAKVNVITFSIVFNVSNILCDFAF